MITRWPLFCILFVLLGTVLFAQELPPELLEETTSKEYNFKAEFLRMLFILGLIVAMIFGTAWMFRRLGKSRIKAFNRNSAIRVLERRAVSAKSFVYLIEVEGTKIVVGDSAAGLTGLAVLANDEQIVPTPPEKGGFGAMLREKLEKVTCKEKD